MSLVSPAGTPLDAVPELPSTVRQIEALVNRLDKQANSSANGVLVVCAVSDLRRASNYLALLRDALYIRVQQQAEKDKQP